MDVIAETVLHAIDMRPEVEMRSMIVALELRAYIIHSSQLREQANVELASEPVQVQGHLLGLRPA